MHICSAPTHQKRHINQSPHTSAERTWQTLNLPRDLCSSSRRCLLSRASSLVLLQYTRVIDGPSALRPVDPASRSESADAEMPTGIASPAFSRAIATCGLTAASTSILPVPVPKDDSETGACALDSAPACRPDSNSGAAVESTPSRAWMMGRRTVIPVPPATIPNSAPGSLWCR